MKKHLFSILAILGFTMSSLSQIPNYVPSNGLVGYWPFNSNANDESGNGNHGVVNGATPSLGKLNMPNTAYSFDGVSNTIDFSNPFFSGNQQSTFTFHALIKFNSLSNSPNIWGKTYDWGEVNLLIESNNSIKFQFANSITGNKYSIIFSDSNAIQSDVWNDIVVVYENSIGRIYLNGTSINTHLQWVAQGGSVISTTQIEGQCNFAQFANSSKLGLRYTGGSPGNYLNGVIDELGIWNRALSQEEITALYSGVPVAPPTACNPLPANLQNGLVGYWPFCGNANDESGNGNDGTVSGAAITTDRFGNTGNAYAFDCSHWGWGSGGDEIYIPYNQSFNSPNLTVSVWANSSSIYCSGQSHVILNRFQYGYSNPNGQVWGVEFEPTNQSQIRSKAWAASSQNNQANITNNGPTSLIDQWVNIILSFDGSYLRQYVNGNLTDIDSLSGFSLNTAGNSGISIGLSDQANGHWGPFDGKIDDIGIWNRALSQQEIQQLFSGTSCVSPTASITAGGPTSFCSGGNVLLSAPSDTSYTYQWQLNGSAINSATSATYSANASGDYSVIISNGASCSDTSAVTTVTVNPLPTVTLTSLPTFVNIQTPSVALNGAPAGGSYSGQGISGTNFIPSTAGLGQAVVSYSYTSTAGCSGNIVKNTIVYDTTGTVCTSYDTIYTSINDTVLVSVQDTLIIETLILGSNPVQSNEIKVYPNPAHSFLEIDNGNFALMGGYTIRIENSLGQVVFNQAVNQQLFSINLSTWTGDGVYYLHIINSNGITQEIKKIVLQ